MSTDPIPANARSSAEVAGILALPVSAVSGLISAGYLKAWLVKPKKYLIDPESLNPFLALAKYSKPTEYSESANHPHPAKHAAPAEPTTEPATEQPADEPQAVVPL